MLNYREVVLRTSCFDSKLKFINALRQTFQGGTFSLYPACTDRVVQKYYQYLKKDYQAGEQGQCHLMTHIGYQSDGYWCLSDEVCYSLNKLLQAKVIKGRKH